MMINASSITKREARRCAIYLMSQEEKQRGWTRTPLACDLASRDCTTDIPATGTSCHCHIFQHLEFICCSIHREHFCLFVCFTQDILPFPQFLHGFLHNSTQGCHLKVREKQRMAETWMFLALLEPARHLTASLGSRKPADSLLGRVHWVMGERQDGPSFPAQLRHWPIYLLQWSSAHAKGIHSAECPGEQWR